MPAGDPTGDRLPEDLDAWAQGLRARIDRGELAGLGPFEIGEGASFDDLETAARIMLTDLDDLDDVPASEHDTPEYIRHRSALVAQFRLLKQRIG